MTLSCITACSAPQDSVLPDPVQAVLGDLTTLFRDAGGEPRADDAVRRADLNADGRGGRSAVLATIWKSLRV